MLRGLVTTATAAVDDGRVDRGVDVERVTGGQGDRSESVEVTR